MTEKQKEHNSKVLELLNGHRKQNQKLCDLQLNVEGRLFPVHRSILAACSPYFFAMFNGELKESKQSVVELKDVDADVIESIIDFSYTGLIQITTENVEKILEHGTLLQFPEVCDICCAFLKEQLNPTNCIGIRHFVSLHACKEFLQVVDDFIKRNFCKVVTSEEFMSIPYDLFKYLLSCHDLNVDCEERVYVAMMKWLKFDTNERSKYFCKLLKEVKLPLITVEFMMKYIDTNPLIRNCLKCLDLLDETKNYHILKQNQVEPQTIRAIPRCSTAGVMVVVGGKEAGESITSRSETFSLYDSKWKEIAPLNCQRQQHGVCELNGHVFAVGGYDGVRRLNSVEIYSPDCNIWTDTTPLQTGRSGVGVAILGDAIYSLGGYDGCNCLTSVERFDPGSESWRYTTPISVTRTFPGVVSKSNRLYVIGGHDGTHFLSSCECYDPLSGKWSFITPLSSPRAGVGCAVLDDILYVAGGFDGSKRYNLVEIYEPRMNAWTVTTPMNSSRDGLCMTAYGGYLFAIGGIDGPSYLNSVEYYDPFQKIWIDTVTMEISRASSGAAVMKNEVLVEMKS